MPELLQDLLAVHALQTFVLSGAWQDVVVPEPEGDKETSHTIEHDAPRVFDVACDHLQITCQHHQQTLSHDGGNTIERRADAHEVSLVMLLKSEHIEAVGSNIVGGTREGHQPEEGQCALQPIGGRDGKRHAA